MKLLAQRAGPPGQCNCIHMVPLTAGTFPQREDADPGARDKSKGTSLRNEEDPL